ncbi:MAG: T9SS type A sorting domain-containing protein [Chitinophagales bacterium]|nr:T9SS type A sorting domain-containing protein [Chitinophagales bacterium]
MSKKNLIQLTSIQKFFQSLFFLILLFYYNIPANSQSTGTNDVPGGGGDGEQVFCFIQDPIINLSCTGPSVKFNTLSFITPKKWDFGDGDYLETDAYEVTHPYKDINPYLNPIKVKLITVDEEECEKDVPIIGVHLGEGCGSVRKVSDLLTRGILPAGQLEGVPVYIYGSLVVDVSYEFKDCQIHVVGGGELIVDNAAKLTLSNNTIVDAFTIIGSCNNLWNGIMVKYGGVLETNLCTIRDAYIGIRVIHEANMSALPMLNLNNTTFEKSFIGIAIEGKVLFSNLINNKFQGSGNVQILSPNSTCNTPLPVSGATFSNRTYCGIFYNGIVGGTFNPGLSINNSFDLLQNGVVALNGNMQLYGCEFTNITYLPSLTTPDQGIAICFKDSKGNKTLQLTHTVIVRNTEKGILAVSNRQGTAVKMKEVEMYNVQNGIELTERGLGNFLYGNIFQCTIECTRYFGRIEQTSVAINIKDPYPLSSQFSVYRNTIKVKQDDYYSFLPGVPNYLNIQPTGILYTSIASVQSSMFNSLVRISENDLRMDKGHFAIWADNTVGAIINQNDIVYPDGFNNFSAPMSGITNIGGRRNFIYCNEVAVDGDEMSYVQGIGAASNTDVAIVSNILKNNLSGISLNQDNGTLCYIHGNQFEKSPTSNNNTIGIFYPNTITGDQVLQGNQWFGDFDFGAYSNTSNYCLSKYYVTNSANVNNLINPVDAFVKRDCDQSGVDDPWFETISANETFDACMFPPFIADEYATTDSDIKLADGYSQSLPSGMQWSALTNLFDKLENGSSIQSNPDLLNFYNTHNNDEIGQMVVARNFYENSNYFLYLLDSVRINHQYVDSLLSQLRALVSVTNITSGKIAILQQIDSLNVINESLESFLNADLETLHLGAMLQFQNVECNSTPCQTEQYIADLFNDAVLVNKRQLDSTELASIKNLASLCEEEYGPSILSARAWYFIETGTRIASGCPTYQIPILQDRSEERVDKSVNTSKAFSISPNPANNVITIEVPEKVFGSTLFLYNIYGQLLLQREITEMKSAVPVSQIPGGTYLLSIRQIDGQVINTEKLIIQR